MGDDEGSKGSGLRGLGNVKYALPVMALSLKRQRFALAMVDALEQGLSATSAALKAGYSPDNAGNEASRLLKDEEVQAAIKEEKEARVFVAGLSRAKVLREFAALAFVDPAEIMRVIVSACMSCWPEEQQRSLRLAGLRVDPNKECKLCGGHGVRNVWLADTRGLSYGARRLIESIEQTKDGIRVKLRDRTPFLLTIAKHMGIAPDKMELSGNVELTPTLKNPKRMTDAELEAAVMAKLGVDAGVSEGKQPLTLEASVT